MAASPTAGTGTAVAVAGEAIMDFVPAGEGLFRAAPGGSPANVAVALARLGVPALFLGRLSSDLLGRRLRAHLEGNGVDLSRAVAGSEPSALAVVDVAPTGGVDYDFRVEGGADWQWRDAELSGALDGVQALHTGSLALTTPPGAGALRRLMARARGSATVSYDPNCRPRLMGPAARVLAGVEEAVGLADVVKASADDVAALLPGMAAADVARGWLAHGPALVAVTLGPHGVLAATRSAGVVRVAGRPVQVIDTVGAGDAFTAGLLAGLHRRDLLGARRRAALCALSPAEITALLAEAVLVAALTCTRRGADPPTAAEVATATRDEPAPSGR